MCAAKKSVGFIKNTRLEATDGAATWNFSSQPYESSPRSASRLTSQTTVCFAKYTSSASIVSLKLGSDRKNLIKISFKIGSRQ
jgi:hypothetical protein